MKIFTEDIFIFMVSLLQSSFTKKVISVKNLNVNILLKYSLRLVISQTVI